MLGANRVQFLNTPEFLSAGTGEDTNNLNHDIFPSLDSLLDISLCERGLDTCGIPNEPNNSWQGSQQTTYPPGSFPDTLNDKFALDHGVSFPPLSPGLSIDEPPQLSTRSPSTTNSNADRDCSGRCYVMLLQQLLFLHRSLPEFSRPSVDAILLVERNLYRNVSGTLLQCTTCGSNRSTLLLLSTVIERIVLMFNWIIEKKTLMDSKNARLSRLALCSWAQNPSVPPPADSFQRTFCHVPLMVGNVEMDAKTKHTFMKPLIILRIKKLAAMLQELSRITASRSQDCLCRAAELILMDCKQRLDYLRGQVQTWE
ncbi:AflR-like C6 zinc cluster transcription factor, putative [Trichophyton verrucosum HKI 0517]|uniref:AflR-like C6 zinc cluster transcription factor, putative n=1 Tax=Trichophyton verrucosum (strain HKI 0517) TaxID=663202 RepID=D4D634_TRIVH|nr:AflR-like C6 zinc cluster transcription factor, putative [Trichophyton verrucosum HKI 0517]EFE42684.1 AflR-like C6 zinc cluster transcription factor, putative [Trichophyton verrucosum HKI 0517]